MMNKTDHRVKSQTQRAASDAIFEMTRADRKKRAVWKPSKSSYKTKKQPNKESLGVMLASIFLLTVLSILAYTVYINFIYEPPIKFKGYY